MSKVDSLTMDEIRERHPGCFILANDAGDRLLDVLVWDTEEDSVNDDGYNAIARYTIRV